MLTRALYRSEYNTQRRCRTGRVARRANARRGRRSTLAKSSPASARRGTASGAAGAREGTRVGAGAAHTAQLRAGGDRRLGHLLGDAEQCLAAIHLGPDLARIDPEIDPQDDEVVEKVGA